MHWTLTCFGLLHRESGNRARKSPCHCVFWQITWEMGSHSWVREAKKDGKGKTYVAGAAVVVPAASVKKRKLVWTRDQNEQNNHESDGKRNVTKREDTRDLKTRGQPSLENQEKRQKLEQLKKKIAAKESSLRSLKTSLNSNDDGARNFQAESDAREQRRNKLNAGFADAFASAMAALAEEINASKKPIVFADDAEIKRILSAKSDYIALGVSPGADATAIRKRYRQVAVTVHPDKCKHPQASQAFQRIVSAYKQISKYAA